MLFNSTLTDKGININLKNKKFNLRYPTEIWKDYPLKEFLLDNLSYILTISSSLINNSKEMQYNTSKPLLKTEVDKSIIKEIPSSAEDYKKLGIKIINQFRNLSFKFKDNNVKKNTRYTPNLKERAVIPFSAGKDSLLTLALSHELGLKPVLHYVDDTISPAENKIKRLFTKKIAKKFNLDYYITRNEIENINDFEFWNKPETTLGYSHMIYSFVTLSLPIMHHHRCKYLFLGNEQSLNFPFKTKEGSIVFPSPDQTPKGTLRINKTIKKNISNKFQIASVIEPLTNLAIIKILHTRYKQFGKYQISCDCLDGTNKKRWCQENSMCADTYLFMKANKINPKIVGLNKNMFRKNLINYYSLFNGKHADRYDRSSHSRDQQLFAFYLAYKNKAKGYAIDLFKKKFLKEAQNKEDEFYKTFYKVYPAITMPPKLRKQVNSIYKEELNQ